MGTFTISSGLLDPTMPEAHPGELSQPIFYSCFGWLELHLSWVSGSGHTIQQAVPRRPVTGPGTHRPLQWVAETWPHHGEGVHARARPPGLEWVLPRPAVADGNFLPVSGSLASPL